MDDGCSLPVGCLHSFKAVHTMCFAMKHIVGFCGLYFFLQRLRPLSTTCTSFTVNLEIIKSWTSLVILGNLLSTIYFVLLWVPSLILQFCALLATHALMRLFPVESVVYSLISYLLTFIAEFVSLHLENSHPVQMTPILCSKPSGLMS